MRESRNSNRSGNQRQTQRIATAVNRITFADVLYHSRWILLPFYLSLIPVLVLYLVRYLAKLKALYEQLWGLSDSEFLLNVLHMLDIVMIGNLIVMIMIGGFVSFIRKLRLPADQLELGWLTHVDAVALKCKLGLSLIGVSSVHLLEAFVQVKNLDPMSIAVMVIIHLVFVVSTVAISWVGTKMAH
jgi:uncharacterized protein (TIGR00645 family)